MCPLVIRNQAVTPIEHRVQRFVQRQRGVTAAPEQAEAVVEQLRGVSNPKGDDATGRELNGKWLRGWSPEFELAVPR